MLLKEKAAEVRLGLLAEAAKIAELLPIQTSDSTEEAHRRTMALADLASAINQIDPPASGLGYGFSELSKQEPSSP